MNIFQKLVEVRKVVPYLQKSAKGHQYNYVSSSQVLAAVRQKMDELNLLLIPRVIGHNVREDMVVSKDKYGNEKHTTTYFTELDMTFTWVNADNPEETIECPMYAQGVDIAGEKGVGKAMTYAEKFFLLKQFNIATDQDDPDAFQKKHGLDEQQEGTDGKTVEIPDEQPPKAIVDLYTIKKGSADGVYEWFNKERKRGYSAGNLNNNLYKEITVPEGIRDAWMAMYAGDDKMLAKVKDFYIKKRSEGMSNDEIESKLAQTIADNPLAVTPV